MATDGAMESSLGMALVCCLLITVHGLFTILFDTNPVLKAKPNIGLRTGVALGSGGSVAGSSPDGVLLGTAAIRQTETIGELSLGIILISRKSIIFRSTDQINSNTLACRKTQTIRELSPRIILISIPGSSPAAEWRTETIVQMADLG
jgi:hypothetical protein